MHKKLQKLKDNIAQLSPFIAPYKWGFWGAVLMGIISIAAMTTAPRIEGMITTQLAKDASDLMQKLPGSRRPF